MIQINSLNSVQQQIVNHGHRTAYVIGGPGTGKTLTLVLRAIRLIQINQSVLLLAPSQSSKQRIQELFTMALAQHQLLQDAVHNVHILTLHEYIDAVLLHNQQITHTEEFRQRISSGGSGSLFNKRKPSENWYFDKLADIVAKRDMDVHQFHQLIMYLRSSDIDVSRPQVQQNIGEENVLRFNEYDQFVKQHHVVHEDDLAHYALHIVRHNDVFIPERFMSVKHVIIDDFQEYTNVERQLIMHMSRLAENPVQLMLCMDDDQALLRYPRAAARHAISRFAFNLSSPIRENEESVTYSLSQNYRFSESYAQMTHAMVSKNALRIHKHTVGMSYTNTQVFHVEETKHSSSFLDLHLLHAVNDWQKLHANEIIAVIGRTSAQIRQFELTCLLQHVVTKPVGITPILKLPYIRIWRDLMHLLQDLDKPLDQVDRFILARVLYVYLPPTQRCIRALIKLQSIDVPVSLNELFHVSKNWWQTTDELRDLADFLRILHAQLQTSMPAYQVIEWGYQFLQIDHYLRRLYGHSTEYAEHLMIVKQFIEFWSYRKTPANQLRDTWRGLYKTTNNKKQPTNIILTTVEYSAGHEYDVVVVPRCMDGYMPAYGCDDNPSNAVWITTSLHKDVIERERRWFYVAMTRAKKALFWSTAASSSSVEVSRFLSEMGLVAPQSDNEHVKVARFVPDSYSQVKRDLNDRKSLITTSMNRDRISKSSQNNHEATTHIVSSTRLATSTVSAYQNLQQRDEHRVNDMIAKTKRFTEGSSDWFTVREKVESSYAIVAQLLHDLTQPERFEGFDRFVIAQFKRMDQDKVDSLTYAKKQLFTTRIDYSSNRTPTNVETIYISPIGVDECDIVSWTSPLASDLMYKRISTTYDQVARYIVQTNVIGNHLKSMRLTYADASMLDDSTDTSWLSSDKYLQEMLAATSRAEMRHIVQTIQSEQYEIISAPSAQLEIVQGAPGTGKTSVALHRLAYLLANDKSISIHKVLFLGPNDIFFSYIKDVLPSLGVKNVKSQTVMDWLVNDVQVKKISTIEDELLAVPYDKRRTYMIEKSHLVSLHAIQQVEIFVDLVWEDYVTKATVNPVNMANINNKLRQIIELLSTDASTVRHETRYHDARIGMNQLTDTIALTPDLYREMYGQVIKRNVDGYNNLKQYLVESLSVRIDQLWPGKKVYENLAAVVNDIINKINHNKSTWLKKYEEADIRKNKTYADWRKQFQVSVKKVNTQQWTDVRRHESAEEIIRSLYATSMSFENKWIDTELKELHDAPEASMLLSDLKRKRANVKNVLERAELIGIYKQAIQQLIDALPAEDSRSQFNYAGKFVEFVEEGVLNAWGGRQVRDQILHNKRESFDQQLAPYTRMSQKLAEVKNTFEGKSLPAEFFNESAKSHNGVKKDAQNNTSNSIVNQLIIDFDRYLSSFNVIQKISQMFSHLRVNLSKDALYRVINTNLLQLDAVQIVKPNSYQEHLLYHVLSMFMSGYKSRINYQTQLVVIDEAQDLNPLLYLMIRRYMPNVKIAAYGDMAQSIFQDVQGNMWEQIARAVGYPDVTPQYLLTTYRSTKSIMDLAKRVLSKFPLPDYQYANAVVDSGIAPTITQVSSFDALMTYALEQKALHPQFTYAIVFKTHDKVRDFVHTCAKYKQHDSFVSYENDQGEDRQSHIYVTYTSKVKGLEYDVVILANVDDVEYPADAYHARLLYVAISRASKDLHVTYQSHLSSLLE